MKTALYNQNAKSIGDVELNDSVFNDKVNDKILSQYTYIYLSNKRQSTAHTKDKSEVSGGGKKPWNQKGTGRARAGSSRSPIWKGGGVTHGPTNQTNWNRKMTKKFIKAAIRNAFTKVAQLEKLKIVDKFEFDSNTPSTKKAIEMISSFENPRKLTIITDVKNPALMNSVSNIKNANVMVINEVNAFSLINGGTILIEEKAIEYINKHWAK